MENTVNYKAHIIQLLDRIQDQKQLVDLYSIINVLAQHTEVGAI